MKPTCEGKLPQSAVCCLLSGRVRERETFVELFFFFKPQLNLAYSDK